MRDKFKTKSGRLTRYALACSYQEVKEIDEDNRASLVGEPNCYHIKGFKNGEHFWETRKKLKEARKFFDNCLRGERL